MFDFYGIYPPAITPFRDDFSIDKKAYGEVLELLIADGVHGIIVGGTTGEYYAQSMEERIGLFRLSRDIIKGRVPMICGTGAIRTEDSITYAKAALKAKADAILVTTPPYALPTPRENALHALSVQRACGLPVLLYNYPGRMGSEMDEEYLDRVGQSPAFCAIKESSGDVNRIHLLARRYPHIGISCGMDDQALEFFAWGARSWVCAAGNFAAPAHLALWRACVVEGDFEKGRRIMTALLPLMQALEQGGKLVQFIKYGIGTRGINAGPPRPPMRPLNKDERRSLDQVIAVMNTTISDIEREK